MTYNPSIGDGAQLMDIMQLQATLAGYHLVDADGVTVDPGTDPLTFDVSELDTDRDLFALDAILSSGAGGVLFSIPDGEDGPIPEALEDWLEAIASESIVDAQQTKTLISRSDVRK